MIAPYCPLPITDKRRGYIPSYDTDVRKTFEQHAPILVCPVDDYDLVSSQDWLEVGNFK